MRLIKHNCTYILFGFQLEIKNNPAVIPQIPTKRQEPPVYSRFFDILMRSAVSAIGIIRLFVHSCLFIFLANLFDESALLQYSFPQDRKNERDIASRPHDNFRE